MAEFVVMDERTGAIIEPGDTVTDFRGNTARLAVADRAREPGRTGKVIVDWSDPSDENRSFGYYYDTVFSLAVVDVASGAAFPCGCLWPTIPRGGHQTGCKYNA